MYFTQRGVHFPLQSRACSTSNFASNYRSILIPRGADSHTINADIAVFRANMKAYLSQHLPELATTMPRDMCERHCLVQSGYLAYVAMKFTR